MRVMFVCGCLEPGRDGVGDYTLALSEELKEKGWTVSAIAINDKFCKTLVNEEQGFQNAAISILRLPATWKKEKRFGFAKKFINSFKPDWISLQFVIYSHHRKGLPLNLGKSLAELARGCNWHIMFHEIWIGISPFSKLKDKIIGYVQKQIIISIVKAVSPKVITTSNVLYQFNLRNASIDPIILPLFSNIPIAPKNNAIISDLLGYIGLKNERDLESSEIVGIFGRLHPDTNLVPILNELIASTMKKGLKLVLVTIGRIGDHGIHELSRLEQIFTQDIKFVHMGERSQDEISTVMQLMTKGISCTPLPYIGKSGVYAAMKLHRIDMIVPEDHRFPQYDNEIRKSQSEMERRPSEDWSVSHVAKSVINLLSIS